MSKSDLIADLENTVKPRKRLFEAGNMKLLVLHLISQAPKFSYDIIKEVGAVVGGGYSPSTGTIYPTLNYLEEQRYIRTELNAEDRKQYRITDAGKVHLQEQQDTVQHILSRFDTRKQIQNNQQYAAIKSAIEQLKSALRDRLQDAELNAEQIQKIAAQIEQAATTITRM